MQCNLCMEKLYRTYAGACIEPPVRINNHNHPLPSNVTRLSINKCVGKNGIEMGDYVGNVVRTITR